MGEPVSPAPPAPAPLAPVVFCGWQARRLGPPLALYTLTRAIPGHPAGSTLSAPTLLAAGFRLPPPSPAEEASPGNPSTDPA